MPHILLGQWRVSSSLCVRDESTHHQPQILDSGHCLKVAPNPPPGLLIMSWVKKHLNLKLKHGNVLLVVSMQKKCHVAIFHVFAYTM